MARPKLCVRRAWVRTDPSRTFPGAEGHQAVSATGLRPSTGTTKENDKPVSVVGNSTASHIQDPIRRPPTPQLPAKRQVKTEQDFVLAVEEKRSLETPVSATIFYTFPAAEGQQATATAVWPSTLAPAKEELGYGAGGQIPLLSDVLREQRAQLEKGNQRVIPAAPAPASDSTAAVVVKKPRAPRGLKLSDADLESEGQLLLTEKATKLGVSLSWLKNRRRSAHLGRWQGRQVRAEMKREEAQARRA